MSLVLLTPAYLRGEPVALGFTDPHGFLADAQDLVALRLADLAANPAFAPWLPRAIVAAGAAVGFINFHAPPDARGMVEIGYEVLPAFRRRGYAAAALADAEALARDLGARVMRASVAPDNVASHALLARAGYIVIGGQLDDIDGRELVYEKPLG